MQNPINHIHLNQVESTQDHIFEHTDQSSFPNLVSTNFQSRGRGRREKSWKHYPEGITFSFDLKVNKDQPVTLIPLEIGALVYLYFNKKMRLKWPNDLLLETGHKCGGILSQLKDKRIVIGIGLNLQSKGSRPIKDKTYSYEAGGFYHALPKAHQKLLPLEITKFIHENRLNSEKLFEIWKEACFHKDQLVEIKDDKESMKGYFKGLGQYGQAILENEKRETQEAFSGSLFLI